MRMKHIAAALMDHECIAILCHVSPDGDTLGSALAIRRALISLGRAAVVVCQDEVPQMYRFMPDAETVMGPDSLPFVPDCALFVDIAAADRAGTALPVGMSAPCKVLLDHHATNEGFVPIHFVDGDASSVGELSLELIDQLGVALDLEMAVQIYVAIASDTGNFGFSYTTPAALRAVARCIEAGLEIDEVSRRLFRLRTVSRTRLIGVGLSLMERYDGGRIAGTTLTQAAMDSVNATSEATEGLVNYLNEMEGVMACFLATERGIQTKVSLRSGDDVDVGEVAFALGGGGHARAAGVTIPLPPDEAVAVVLEALRRAMG